MPCVAAAVGSRSLVNSRVVCGVGGAPPRLAHAPCADVGAQRQDVLLHSLRQIWPSCILLARHAVLCAPKCELGPSWAARCNTLAWAVEMNFVQNWTAQLQVLEFVMHADCLSHQQAAWHWMSSCFCEATAVQLIRWSWPRTPGYLTPQAQLQQPRPLAAWYQAGVAQSITMVRRCAAAAQQSGTASLLQRHGATSHPRGLPQPATLEASRKVRVSTER